MWRMLLLVRMHLAGALYYCSCNESDGRWIDAAWSSHTVKQVLIYDQKTAWSSSSLLGWQMKWQRNAESHQNVERMARSFHPNISTSTTNWHKFSHITCNVQKAFIIFVWPARRSDRQFRGKTDLFWKVLGDTNHHGHCSRNACALQIIHRNRSQWIYLERSECGNCAYTVCVYFGRAPCE